MPPSGRHIRNGHSSKAPPIDDYDHSNTSISINTSQLLGRKNNRLNDLLKKPVGPHNSVLNGNASKQNGKESTGIESKLSSQSKKRKSTFEEDDGFVFKRRPDSQGSQTQSTSAPKESNGSRKVIQKSQKSAKSGRPKSRKVEASNEPDYYSDSEFGPEIEPEIKEEDDFDDAEFVEQPKPRGRGRPRKSANLKTQPKTQPKAKAATKAKAKTKAKPNPNGKTGKDTKQFTKFSVESDHIFHNDLSSPFRSNINKKKKLPQALSSPPSPPESSPSFIEQVSSHQITLPLTDTPINRKNKQLRDGKRRSSLSNRGKRVSSIGNGFIAAPHPDVSPTEYHKLLDPSLPEPHKMRQLLIWCFKRVLEQDNERINQDKKIGKLRNNDETTVINIAKVIKDELIHDLVNGKLNTSWYNRPYDDDIKPKEDGSENIVKLLPNSLNMTNESNIKIFEKRLQDLKKEGEKWESSFNECLEPVSGISISLNDTIEPSETTLPYTDVLNQSILRNIESTKEDLTMDLTQNLEYSIDNVYDLTHKLNSTSRIMQKFNEDHLKRLTSAVKNYVKKDEKFVIVHDSENATDNKEKVLDTKELLRGITRLDKGS